jgi:hypothetical protein
MARLLVFQRSLAAFAFAFACALVAGAGARESIAAEPAFRVMSDIVAEGVCVHQSVFAPGDTIIWRAVVQGDDGVPLAAGAIAARGITAVVTLRDGTTFKLRPPAAHAPAPALFWTVPWKVPVHHPTGTLPWTLTVTDRSGGKTVFTPIGQAAGAAVLTIAKKTAASRA